jgi:predicted nucleic acid-binding protein
MRILLDTNIILDVLLRRSPWSTESSAVWQAVDNEQVSGWITASSLTDIFYIVRRSSNVNAAQEAVQVCLKTFAICNVDRAVLEEATTLPGEDFEDNLQIVCASLAQLDFIITRDKAGFRESIVPVLTPVEFLHKLRHPED